MKIQPSLFIIILITAFFSIFPVLLVSMYSEALNYKTQTQTLQNALYLSQLNINIKVNSINYSSGAVNGTIVGRNIYGYTNVIFIVTKKTRIEKKKISVNNNLLVSIISSKSNYHVVDIRKGDYLSASISPTANGIFTAKTIVLGFPIQQK